MPYFDLHCHPTFKQILSAPDPAQPRPIEQPVRIEFTGLAAHFRRLILWVFGEPLDSQSAFDQVFQGGSNLLSHTIYAIENAYTKSPVIRQLNCISNTLDQTKIDRIRDNKIGYWALSQEEIQTLKTVAGGTLQNGERAVRIISDFAEYRPDDAKTLHVLLNFEGGHCFYSGQENSGGTVAQDVINNLIAMKKSGIRPLYITLVHHAQNALANHAYAVPSQWAGGGADSGPIGGFTPTGEAITPLGETFIDEALSEINGPPIYIDVKHMSLGSRLAYYALRKKKYPTIPILASHVGVTGLTLHQTQFNGQPVIRWVRREDGYIHVKYNDLISFPKDIPQPSPTQPTTAPTSVVTFNPWSINLYDEEITEILDSDGLIGVSLDVRILGMGNDAGTAHEHEPERLSLNEQLFSVQEHARSGRNQFEQLPDRRIQASLEHVDYFCNNLLHMVRVGRTTAGERVWDHLCLGSDFDGLIVAIELQTNRRVRASTIPELRNKVKEKLPAVAEKMEMQLVPMGRDRDEYLDEVLDKFFFKNANRFLQKYFTQPVPDAPTERVATHFAD